MFSRGDFESFLESGVLKVADDEHDAAAFSGSRKVFDRCPQIGATTNRLRVKDFANQAEPVA